MNVLDRSILDELTVGCSVFERLDEALANPPGGLVVAIDAGGPTPGTGEVRERSFTTVRNGGARGLVWHTIPESRVDLETVEPLDTRRVRDLIRLAAREVADGRATPAPAARGLFKPEHVRLTHLMSALAALLG